MNVIISVAGLLLIIGITVSGVYQVRPARCSKELCQASEGCELPYTCASTGQLRASGSGLRELHETTLNVDLTRP